MTAPAENPTGNPRGDSRCAAEFTRGAKAALKRMAAEVGLKRLAHEMGVSVSQAQRYTDAAAPDVPRLDFVCQAVAHTGAGALAEYLAELAGGRFVPGAADEPAALRDALADTISEAAELIHVSGGALRDGALDAAERRRIGRVILDLEWQIALLKRVLA